jgi:hypothetical protein
MKEIIQVQKQKKEITPTHMVLVLLFAAVTTIVIFQGASAAELNYTSEYHSFKTLNDMFFGDEYVFDTYGEDTLDWNSNVGAYASLATARELRRQTILLEKQNELIAESNKVAWINACYAPHTAYGGSGAYSLNITALKYECLVAGYPVER